MTDSTIEGRQAWHVTTKHTTKKKKKTTQTNHESLKNIIIYLLFTLFLYKILFFSLFTRFKDKHEHIFFFYKIIYIFVCVIICKTRIDEL